MKRKWQHSLLFLSSSQKVAGSYFSAVIVHFGISSSKSSRILIICFLLLLCCHVASLFWNGKGLVISLCLRVSVYVCVSLSLCGFLEFLGCSLIQLLWFCLPPLIYFFLKKLFISHFLMKRTQ